MERMVQFIVVTFRTHEQYPVRNRADAQSGQKSKKKISIVGISHTLMKKATTIHYKLRAVMQTND